MPTPGEVFVGRSEELGELLSGLEDAIAARGRVFLLAGEPGIGKTRLADEVARRAREKGAEVHWGRCWEAGGAPAYWPWIQIMRALVREAALADDDARRSEWTSLAALVPDVRPPSERALPLPQPDAFDLYDAV